MWDEVCITPTLGDGSPWELKMGPTAEVTWIVDSEFHGDKEKDFREKLEDISRKNALEAAKAAGEVEAVESEVDSLTAEAEALGIHAQNTATVNILAMSANEFEAYLRKLRKLRPTFQRFLEVKSALDNPKAPVKSIWERSQKNSEEHKRFLSAQMQVKYDSRDAHVIEQQPHKAGGLMYARTPLLQSLLLTKDQPGRILRTRNSPSRGTYGFNASFAGHNTSLDKTFMGKDSGPMDWEDLARFGTRDPTQGLGRFKLLKTRLIDPPSVVGPKPGGLRSSVVLSEVRAHEGVDEMRPNPHWPGSREYVGKNEQVVAHTGMLRAAPPPPKKGLKGIEGDKVIDTLIGILERHKKAKEAKATPVP